MDTFRELLAHLEARGEMRHVGRSVDPRFELTAVMRKMQKGPNQALMFDNVAGSPMPVVTNVFGFRSAVAAALDLDEASLLPALVEKENKILPVAEADVAPVQEVVISGNEIDVARDVPQIVFSELDGGAYITAGVLIARHPKTGVYNASWTRAELVGG
ncbi:MAG: UbiD family decarboxylase, partial [Alphaproteobacteria bacterium]|nr:UbiD family decarboxylase [Alphaproteobacteria bacterium]